MLPLSYFLGLGLMVIAFWLMMLLKGVKSEEAREAIRVVYWSQMFIGMVFVWLQPLVYCILTSLGKK